MNQLNQAEGATSDDSFGSQRPSESRLRKCSAKRVLLVDDNAVARTVLRAVLELSPEPFTIYEATSGEEALRVLDDLTVDCVLLDVHLPELGGLELADRLQKNYGSEAPAVIMVTGDDSQKVGVDSMLHGAAGVVSKLELKTVDLPGKIREAISTRRRVQRALSQRLEAFSRLVQDTAHNINNPTMVAHLSLSAIGETLFNHHSIEPAPPLDLLRLRALLGAANEALDRISQVMRNLQNETGTSLGHVHRFRLSDVVARALMRPTTEPPLSVVCHLDSQAELVGDLSQLSRMLVDLLRNALEAGGPQGTVHIRSWDEGYFTNLTVDDEGNGVPQEEASWIFDPLYTTHSERGALGMGLARVASIASRHGGSVGVEQAPSGGARLHVRLPHAYARRARPQEPAPQPVRRKVS